VFLKCIGNSVIVMVRW